MQNLTEEGRRLLAEAARRHGVSENAAETVLAALAVSGGRMAQFSHPELGGMGQWTQGGMVMVGDMFNTALKARVDALCTDLAGLLGNGRMVAASAQAASQSQFQGSGVAGAGFSDSSWTSRGSGQWWPADLGTPSSAGAQNDMRYAFFPERRRLLVQAGGRLSAYDTGDHAIFGFGQQQGGDQSLTFTSDRGAVRLSDLRRVEEGTEAATLPQQPAGSVPEAPPGSADVIATLERLAGLRDKGVISEEEFAAKKRELLARL
ncbi:MAG: SHOCT domain-containing protein [Acetobacteraceae bacterium]|nr:SHOCT domain-containing protein [Acetobacteraceae bacterium]